MIPVTITRMTTSHIEVDYHGLEKCIQAHSAIQRGMNTAILRATTTTDEAGIRIFFLLSPYFTFGVPEYSLNSRIRTEMFYG